MSVLPDNSSYLTDTLAFAVAFQNDPHEYSANVEPAVGRTETQQTYFISSVAKAGERSLSLSQFGTRKKENTALTGEDPIISCCQG